MRRRCVHEQCVRGFASLRQPSTPPLGSGRVGCPEGAAACCVHIRAQPSRAGGPPIGPLLLASNRCASFSLLLFSEQEYEEEDDSEEDDEDEDESENDEEEEEEADGSPAAAAGGSGSAAAAEQAGDSGEAGPSKASGGAKRKASGDGEGWGKIEEGLSG